MLLIFINFFIMSMLLYKIGCPSIALTTEIHNPSPFRPQYWILFSLIQQILLLLVVVRKKFFHHLCYLFSNKDYFLFAIPYPIKFLLLSMKLKYYNTLSMYLFLCKLLKPSFEILPPPSLFVEGIRENDTIKKFSSKL